MRFSQSVSSVIFFIPAVDRLWHRDHPYHSAAAACRRSKTPRVLTQSKTPSWCPSNK